MPDWNEINRRKRREMNLGMAKNGAVLLLKDMRRGHWSEFYKETARLLFLLNEELDRELLEGKMLDEKALEVKI